VSDDTIVLERLFDADAQALYEAWTDPEIMAQWFFVGADWSVEVENELHVGGGFRLSMRVPSGATHTMHGEYLELDPDRRIVFSWTSHVAENTRVTIDLEPRGDQTLLRLTHELVPTPDAREAHRQGWGGCLDNLASRGLRR
jgi:uncharacterized protein YndB with AHSA1/START domain